MKLHLKDHPQLKRHQLRKSWNQTLPDHVPYDERPSVAHSGANTKIERYDRSRMHDP